MTASYANSAIMPPIAPPAGHALAAGWAPPPFPPAKVLEGQWCRLEPLDVARHLDDIWAAAAGHDAMWDWLPDARRPTRMAIVPSCRLW